MAGAQVGISETTGAFSACYGEPFLVYGPAAGWFHHRRLSSARPHLHTARRSTTKAARNPIRLSPARCPCRRAHQRLIALCRWASPTAASLAGLLGLSPAPLLAGGKSCLCHCSAHSLDRSPSPLAQSADCPWVSLSVLLHSIDPAALAHRRRSSHLQRVFPAALGICASQARRLRSCSSSNSLRRCASEPGVVCADASCAAPTRA